MYDSWQSLVSDTKFLPTMALCVSVAVAVVCRLPKWLSTYMYMYHRFCFSVVWVLWWLHLINLNRESSDSPLSFHRISMIGLSMPLFVRHQRSLILVTKPCTLVRSHTKNRGVYSTRSSLGRKSDRPSPKNSGSMVVFHEADVYLSWSIPFHRLHCEGFLAPS